jgi:hypothetical protein
MLLENNSVLKNFEEHDILGYNAVWFSRSSVMFQRNASSPCLRLKSMPREKPAMAGSSKTSMGQTT